MANSEAAIGVVRRLRDAGFTAFLAGGCVRDMLLGRQAKDYDVASDAGPGDVIDLFRQTIKVGAKFGVVIVMAGDEKVEVATFRRESGYVDGRHPGEVEFSVAKEDASRRDFTINGMFYDPIEDKVIDYVGGEADLGSRLIRTIGDAEERFDEDYLRMLRAVRFSTQLGFAIEDATWKAIGKLSGQICKISGERIAMELEGILCAARRAEGARMLFETGLAESIFGAFDADEIERGLGVLGYLRRRVDFGLALSGFFAGVGSDEALRRCGVLRLSRNVERQIRFLLDGRGRLLEADIGVAELKTVASAVYFRDLYELERAIQKSVAGDVGKLAEVRRRIREFGDVELQPRPLLNGRDLIRLGAVAGPEVGLVMEAMYVAQLEGVVCDKASAEIWVRQWLDRHRDLED